MRARHLAAARLDADLTEAMLAVRGILGEMGRLAERCLSTEGARRSIADAAFALYLGTAASADDAEMKLRLLGILVDGQREGQPSPDVIRAGMALEEALGADLWPGAPEVPPWSAAGRPPDRVLAGTGAADAARPNAPASIGAAPVARRRSTHEVRP